MAKTENAGTFKAISNVNILLSLNVIPEVRAWNKQKLAEMREINPSITELPNAGVYDVTLGEVLTFGDDAVIDSDTGRVLVYPVSLWDKLMSTEVDLPNPAAGEVGTTAFNAKFKGLPDDIVKDFIGKLNERQLSNITVRSYRFTKIEVA
jgi:hypothetical protein